MIKYENIFLTKIGFGMDAKDYIILAENTDNAIKTVGSYFSEHYDILYILSFERLNTLVEKLQVNSETFYFVIEVDSKIINENNREVEEFFFNEYEEWGKEENFLLEKYKERKVILVDREEIANIVQKAYSYLENEDIETLIADEFLNLI